MLRSDGSTLEVRYEELFVREGARVWLARVIPPAHQPKVTHRDAGSAPHAHGHGHGHGHADFSTAPRLVTRAADGGLDLTLVDEDADVVVEVVPEEYERVGFRPDWSLWTQLLDDGTLARLKPAGPSARRGTRWLEGELDGAKLRVRWSDTLGAVLELDTRSADGRTQHRMALKRKSSPSPVVRVSDGRGEIAARVA